VPPARVYKRVESNVLVDNAYAKIDKVFVMLT